MSTCAQQRSINNTSNPSKERAIMQIRRSEGWRHAQSFERGSTPANPEGKPREAAEKNEV
jgi:hypothetical protein